MPTHPPDGHDLEARIAALEDRLLELEVCAAELGWRTRAGASMPIAGCLPHRPMLSGDDVTALARAVQGEAVRLRLAQVLALAEAEDILSERTAYGRRE